MDEPSPFISPLLTLKFLLADQLDGTLPFFNKLMRMYDRRGAYYEVVNSQELFRPLLFINWSEIVRTIYGQHLACPCLIGRTLHAVPLSCHHKQHLPV
jgi:hypothetical protein